MYIITAKTTSDSFKVEYLKIVRHAQFINHNTVEFVTSNPWALEQLMINDESIVSWNDAKIWKG